MGLLGMQFHLFSNECKMLQFYFMIYDLRGCLKMLMVRFDF